MGHVRSVGAFILLLIVGCQSTPARSPQIGKNQKAEWLRDYRNARASETSQPEASCTLYRKLSDNPNFPLRELSGLRARRVCRDTTREPLNRETLPSYLREAALDIDWDLSTAAQDEARLIDLAVEKSKAKRLQSEKVAWMQLAIEKAKATAASGSDGAARLPELEKRLHMIAPRLQPQPPRDKWLEVAHDFRMARKFTEANEFYEKVIRAKKMDLQDRVSALKGLRLSLKNARRNEEHVEASKRLVSFLTKMGRHRKKDPKWISALYEAGLYLARAQWTLGQSQVATETLASLERSLKGKTSLAEVYWIRARLAEEKGQPDEVTRWLEKSLQEPMPNTELQDKIVWYAGWNARTQKKWDEAGQFFQKLQQQTPSDTWRSRALYWYGRTLHEQNKTAESKLVFEQLMSTDPLGYYGMLAHKQMGVAIRMPKTNVTPARTLATTGSAGSGGGDAASSRPLDGELADWLYWAHEKEALTSYLDLVSAAYRKSKSQEESVWTDIFKHYAKAGLYVKLYENLGTIDAEQRKAILEHNPELLFPQPWSDDVRTASLQFSIDEEFIYAVMRQESAFDPRARSGADAFGLMQILPEVGQRLAQQNNLPYSDMESLYDPRLNIQVGAAHLKDLLNRNRGQFILAVASYNASESAIRNWMKNRFRGDSLEFIEEIPYEETRTYVRLVMRNLIFYRLLKSQSASIEFPAWVLNLDQG